MKRRSAVASILSVSLAATVVVVIAAAGMSNSGNEAHAQGEEVILEGRTSPSDYDGHAHADGQTHTIDRAAPPRKLPDGAIAAEITEVLTVVDTGHSAAMMSVALHQQDGQPNILEFQVEVSDGTRFRWAQPTEHSRHIEGHGWILLEVNGEPHGRLGNPYYSVIGVVDEAQLGEWELRARLMTLDDEPYIVEGSAVEATVRIMVERH